MLTLLTIVLVILKAFGYITFSWLWVFAPLWMPFSLFILYFIIIFIVEIFS
jgi:hypothetical protein